MYGMIMVYKLVLHTDSIYPYNTCLIKHNYTRLSLCEKRVLGLLKIAKRIIDSE